MYGALGHYVSPARLAKVAQNIPKVLVLTGDDDLLMNPVNSDKLVERLTSGGKKGDTNVEFVKWEKTGHAIPSQWPERVNTLLEKVFEEGRAKSVV